jgi:hypothetical protein
VISWQHGNVNAVFQKKGAASLKSVKNAVKKGSLSRLNSFVIITIIKGYPLKGCPFIVYARAQKSALSAHRRPIASLMPDIPLFCHDYIKIPSSG